MARQITTAISDLVLALSVVYFIYHVIFLNFFAAIGLGIQGAAAAFGVVRFGMSRADASITEYHKLLSWLAQVVGVPLLGIGFVHNIMPLMVTLNFLFVIAVIVSSRFLESNMRKLLTEACSGFGMLSIIIASVYTVNIWGLLAAALYVVSGLFIGSEGYMTEIPALSSVRRVDALHYCLALANLFFLYAIV